MRQGELDNARKYFRSQTRVFNLNGSWYFATREGDKGPFSTRQLAEVEALRYADENLALCGFQESREAERGLPRDVGQRLTIVPIEESAPRRHDLTLEPDLNI